MTTSIEKHAPVTDDDLRQAAESLGETEDLWSKLAAMADPTVVCDECGGTGTLAGGGIFGEIQCPTCQGSRVVEHPAAHAMKQLAMPDFKGLRARLRALSTAHDQAQRKAYLGESSEVGPGRDELAALEKDIAKVREEGRDHAVKHTLESGRKSLPLRRRTRDVDRLGSGDFSDDAAAEDDGEDS